MKITKAQKEELLAKAAVVLEEVVNEYESLEKMEVEEVADPTRKAEAPKADELAAMSDAKPEEKDASDEDKDEEEAEEEDDEHDKDEEQDDESDKDLEDAYKSMTAKMEARGLLKKTEEKAAPAPAVVVATEVVQKSETAQGEDLKKSIDDRFESLSKTIAGIAEKVDKIASQPKGRKGAAGYTPLRKTEEGAAEGLNKSDAINHLLDLKKNGDKRINTALINRLETNRETQEDVQFVKGIVG